GSYIFGVDSSILTSPNGKSIEISFENYNLVKNELINIKSDEDFYSKYSLFYHDDFIIESDDTSLISMDNHDFKLEILDKNNKIQRLDYNKEYLVITKDNKIKYST